MRALRQFTMARVGLGRAGNSIPVREMLEFQLAHARARDAVYFPFDARALRDEVVADLRASGAGGIAVKSAARDRAEYLRRPDLGRKLDAASVTLLGRSKKEFDIAFVLADGLSPLAVHRHATGLFRLLLPRLGDWNVAPVIVVEQGRVAIGDEIGFLLGASLVVVLIGERPGLSSPDSLGAYLTWSPRPGKTDADRNCISNIRDEGLNVPAAAELLLLLMQESRTRQISGVQLKPGGLPPVLPSRTG